MTTTFDTTDYVFSTGHSPRGRGSWAFSLVRDPRPEDVFFAPSCTYVEAKKIARAHFGSPSVLYVLT